MEKIQSLSLFAAASLFLSPALTSLAHAQPSSQQRPKAPPAVIKGFALGGETTELAGLMLFPKPPGAPEESQSDSGSDEGAWLSTGDESSGAKKGPPPPQGFLHVGTQRYILGELELTFGEASSEDETQDQPSMSGLNQNSEQRPPRPPPIESIRAKVFNAPSGSGPNGATGDEPSPEDFMQQGSSSSEQAAPEQLEEVGTIELTMTDKEGPKGKVPVAEGTLSLDSGSLTFVGALDLSPPPRLKRDGQGPDSENQDYQARTGSYQVSPSLLGSSY